MVGDGVPDSNFLFFNVTCFQSTPIYFMYQDRSKKMIPACKIDLFMFDKEGNPEDIATSQLL
jgi:hypothetical protein